MLRLRKLLRTQYRATDGLYLETNTNYTLNLTNKRGLTNENFTY